MTDRKAVWIALLIVILTAVLILMQTYLIINTTVLRPDFYDSILKHQEFYGQIRQLALRQANENLRFGQSGLTYLENALTESWLRDQVMDALEQFRLFLNGEQDELPIIPFYKLKEEVVKILNEDIAPGDREELVQYWFDPLPDRVRISYIMSTELFWGMRSIVEKNVWAFMVIVVLIITLIVLLFVLTHNWKDAVLWIAASSASAGGIVIGIGAFLSWAFNYSRFANHIIAAMIEQNIPDKSARGLLEGFSKGVTSGFYTFGAFLLIMGILVIVFIPLKNTTLSTG